MAEEQLENSGDSQTRPNPTSTSVGGFNVGENIDKGIVVIGNNNVVQYASEIEKNTEKHEPDFWALKHPYPMPPNFTGRIAERAMLTYWLKEDSENRLFVVRALGGFGKSALTWHWLTHDVDSEEWSKVFFWSFYEGDPRFENFITETLQYLKLEVPQGGRPQVEKLLDAMQSRKVLLVMDGFERALRLYASMSAPYQSDEEQKVEDNQFDCKDINAEWFLKGMCVRPDIKSKVLMTTRLTPRAIKPHGEFMLGCREEELTAMQKVDAVEFFRKQKIEGTHAEIEAACALYGYHPLSLRLLAGRILKDFESPGDIVVAQKIKIDGDLKAQQHHVLEISYTSLPPHEQVLLSTISCFRSPVELKTLQSISENNDTLNTDLHDLIDRGLLQYTTRLVFNHLVSIFDLHPIVRRYAYERLTVRDRTAAHTRLRDYFAVVDVVAGTQTLDDLAPVIELYFHTVRAGEYEAAYDIYARISDSVFYGLGEYQTLAELIEVLLPSNLSRIKRGKLMTRMASCYASTGQIKNAIFLQEKANSFLKDNRYDFLTGLISLADNQRQVGSLHLAESNLRASINLSKGIEDEYHEAYGHTELGRLLSFCGMWDEVDQELEASIKKDQKREDLQGLCIAETYRALCVLLKTRDWQQLTAGN